MALIQIASDIHTEFIPKEYSVLDIIIPTAPILILAGDVSSILNQNGEYQYKFHTAFSFLLELYREFDHILYVPGNHDYWGTSIEEALKQLKELEIIFPNVTILNNKFIDIEDTRFVGTTLWFKEPTDPETMRLKTFFPDFTYVKNAYKGIADQHKEAIKFLQETPFTEKTVVISHHIPSMSLVHPWYKSSPINPFFVAEDAEEIIYTKEPSLWVYGHTHVPSESKIYHTETICNPRGYPRYDGNILETLDYNPMLIREI